MNPKSYGLDVRLEENQVGDTLECLLHSILFQRQLGPVFPQETALGGALAMIPLTYWKVGQDDDAVNAKVAKEVAQFTAALAGKGTLESKVGQVFPLQLRFMDAQGRGEWERWTLSVRIERRVQPADVHKALLHCLQQINDASDAAIEENYIPPSDTHHEFQISHEVGGSTFFDTMSGIFTFLATR